MQVDPSFVQKLWNKGVDIFAAIISTIISAGIVALIATFTWRWKRQRDLKFEEDKVRQHARIQDELLALKAESEHRAPIRRLIEQRQEFARRAEACTSSLDIAAVESELIDWLTQKDLDRYEQNGHIVAKWYRPEIIDHKSPQRFADDIRRICIPEE